MRPQPCPAAFMGHWLTPGQMAALAGVQPARLRQLDVRGELPAGAVSRTLGGQRRYDAGLVLAARQASGR